jgi:hypothetical protein
MNIFITTLLLLISQCSYPVLANSEVYLESTKVPFVDGLQSDLRGRFSLHTIDRGEFFFGLHHEAYNPLSSDTQAVSRSGPGLGVKVNFLQYFGAVAELRYYWARNSIATNEYKEARYGLYGFHEVTLNEFYLLKAYGEVFNIPRISSSSLTSSGYIRLLYPTGDPSTFRISPYAEAAATENSDSLAFGKSLREVKLGLSVFKKWPETSAEFLLFKNFLENPETGPSEIRIQFVLFGAYHD